MKLTEISMMVSPEEVHPLLFDQLGNETASFTPQAGQYQLRRLVREMRDITGLYNIAVAVGSSLNVKEIIWAIYKESSRILDMTDFAIILYDSRSELLNCPLVFDRGQKRKPFSISRTGYRSLITQVLDSQAPLLINDLLKADPSPNLIPFQTAHRQIRAWLSVPIFNPVRPDEGVQGVIATWSYRPNVFTDRELGLLSAIGTQAAIALRNAHLYQSVLAEKERVIEAEEQARKALARDLHDGPTQVISAVLMHLDYCQLLLKHDPDRLPGELKITKELARQAVEEIRTLLFELRPMVLETEGLIAAIRVFLKRRQRDVEGKTQLSLKIHSAEPGGELVLQDDKVEAALFAIVQEAVNNALKHAEATDIVVEIGETPTDFYVIVSDNGIGFDVVEAKKRSLRQGSLGMINLSERVELLGGELRLQSAPGRGTQVAVQVPKAAEVRKERRSATGPLSPSY